MTTKVHVLPLNGVFDTGLSCLLDTFSVANALAPGLGLDTRFEVRLVGVAPEIETGHGLKLALSGIARDAPDWLLVPALGTLAAEQLVPRLDTVDARVATALLRDYAERGARVGAACTGTFLLGDAGLLDGREASTSWWLSALFRERYPRAHLDVARMLVEDGGCVTVGAAMAHLDLALLVVRRASPTLAEQVARYLVIDSRTAQSTFAIPNHLACNDPVVQRFETWARENLARGFSLADAAHVVGASPRTLSRRLQAALNKSPLAYFQDLRVERAVHLLQTTRASVDQIAAEVGYADGVTLRTLLRKKIGVSARGLRVQGRDAATPPGQLAA